MVISGDCARRTPDFIFGAVNVATVILICIQVAMHTHAYKESFHIVRLVRPAQFYQPSNSRVKM